MAAECQCLGLERTLGYIMCLGCRQEDRREYRQLQVQATFSVNQVFAAARTGIRPWGSWSLETSHPHPHPSKVLGDRMDHQKDGDCLLPSWAERILRKAAKFQSRSKSQALPCWSQCHAILSLLCTAFPCTPPIPTLPYFSLPPALPGQQICPLNPSLDMIASQKNPPPLGYFS